MMSAPSPKEAADSVVFDITQTALRQTAMVFASDRRRVRRGARPSRRAFLLAAVLGASSPRGPRSILTGSKAGETVHQAGETT